MATIHDTTMSPGKLDLLTDWLPAQPWYLASGSKPELTKAGGFRLDDPEGEVGIEFMVVTDRSGDSPVTYQVPLTYRGRALAGARDGLIGTAQHGVLGPRWIYDGTRDPVLVTQLIALIQGAAEPQAQNVSNTPDPTVTSKPVTSGSLAATEAAVMANGPAGTDLRVEATDADGAPGGQLTVRIHRVLRPAPDGLPVGEVPAGETGQPCLSAAWRLPDGTHARGIFASARYNQMPAAHVPPRRH